MNAKIILLFLITNAIGQINCVEENDYCSACNNFYNFMKNLTSNAGDDVQQSLIQLCNEYFDEPKCPKYVRKFFELVSHNFTDSFCNDIKACNEFTGQVSDVNFVENKYDCDFCIFINQKIKELVTGGPTEMAFKMHLEHVCHYLGSYEKDCTSMVDKNVDTLFKFIQDYFQPQDLCYSLRICPKKQTPTINEFINVMPVNISLKDVNSRDSETCFLCKKLVKLIQIELKNNSTKEQIITALSEACSYLTKNKQKCDKMIRDYVSQFIQILSQDIDPDTACLLAGLCDQSTKINTLSEHLHGNAVCVECEMIAHFIQNKIYDYNTELQIEEYIKNHLCKAMSFLINSRNCQAFIDQYGPIIMQTIAQDVFNPDFLCYKELHLCKRTKIHDITYDTKQPVKCEMCQNIIQTLINLPNNPTRLSEAEFVEKCCAKFINTKNTHNICHKMVTGFISYFIDAMDRYDNPKKICESIDICLVPGQVHLLGGYKCTYGPSYWCESISHANACNAHKYCRNKYLESNEF